MIDRTRLLDSLLDSLLVDFIEEDATIRCRIDIQDISEMPRNSFSFTVGVRREENTGGLLRRLLKFLDRIPLAADIDISRFKVIIDIDAESALRQISNMADRSDDLIAASQILADDLRLGRRLDNDKSLLSCRFLRRFLGGCITSCFCHEWITAYFYII